MNYKKSLVPLLLALLLGVVTFIVTSISLKYSFSERVAFASLVAACILGLTQIGLQYIQNKDLLPLEEAKRSATNPNPEIRAIGLRYLQTTKEITAVKFLKKGLSHQNEDIRLDFAITLSSINGNKKAITIVLQALRSNDVNTRKKAVLAFNQIIYPNADKYLIEALTVETDRDLKVEITEILLKRHNPMYADQIVKFLNDKDRYFGYITAEILEAMGNPSVIPELKAIIDQRSVDDAVKVRSIKALVIGNYDDVMPFLLQLARNWRANKLEFWEAAVLTVGNHPQSHYAILSTLKEIRQEIMAHTYKPAIIDNDSFLLNTLDKAIEQIDARIQSKI